MLDITKIDKNFAVNSTVAREGMVFYDPLEAPFTLHGITRGDNCFFRMPPNIAKEVSTSVDWLNYNTAGGRIRFATNSPYVAIFVKYKSVSKMPHFAFCGSVGFDLYANELYVGTYQPRVDITDKFESIVNLPSGGMRDITINFPLYSSVSEIYIGLDKDATLGAAKPYSNEKPIVYYGSSITQGGCASRPGTCYQAYISREFNADYINLGFSGSAKAEDAMIEYLAGLDMGIFVCDYDHNAPSSAHLESTHSRLFSAVRATHPDIPIIFMSRPRHASKRNPDDNNRIEIIKATYNAALAAGDKNVYMLTGDDLTALCGAEGTVDCTHPTDFGFAAMANALIALIKKENLL